MNSFLPRDGIVIVTGTRCPACSVAKRLLDSAHVPYATVQVEQHPEIAELGVRSLPTAFVMRTGKVLRQVSGLPRDFLSQVLAA